MAALGISGGWQIVRQAGEELRSGAPADGSDAPHSMIR